jgi:hypothetical protein
VAEPVARAKAPDFNLPLLTPRERWERLILDEAERVMVASGTLSKAEAIMRVCTEHRDWYAKYQAASNDPKDRSAA